MSAPLDLYGWLGILHPRHAGDVSRSVHMGIQADGHGFVAWRHVLIAQVVKHYERRHVVTTERRIVDGTPNAAWRPSCVGRKETA